MINYTRYKTSGIEWLGDIPIDWTRFRIKFCFNSINGGVWGEEPIGDENDITCIRVADFNYKYAKINTTNLTTRNISIAEQKSRLLKKGDLLIEKSGGGEFSPVGRVVKFDLDIKAVCSNFINRLNTKKQFNSDYLNYLNRFLYSKGVTEICINQTTGIQNLKVGEFLSNSIYIPSGTEQLSIVHFLDYKTGQMDRFIAARQKQIELLKEQKSGIINKAVTKGINPNAKMKPSGIEWIGEIPESWNVMKLKYVAKLQSGNAITSDDIKEIGDYPVYGGNGLRGYTTNYTNDGNFILIGRQGALCGNINYANGQFWASEHAVVSYLRRPTNILWLGELLRTMNLNQYSQAAAQPGLSVDRIKNLPIPCPDYHEQNEIELYIKSETSILDNLSSKYQKQIDLMQEYRTTLISQAVTGKIDVRESV